MNITIFHNPRCSKSRRTLELIESRGVRPTIVDYTDQPPAPDTLLGLARQLGLPLQDLLRRAEPEFAESATPVPVEDPAALARWLHAHPRVLQRPIVVNEDTGHAVVGRPPENVLGLLAE